MTLTEYVGSRARELGEYHGVSTAICFGDPAAEWEALDRGAALLDRSFRRGIAATGDDRVQFLQGQLSSQVNSLSAGDGQASLLLNAQGRVQSILALYDRGDALHLIVDVDLLAATNERLQQFLVADDVEFEPVAESTAIQVALAGPEAAAVLSKVGVKVPPSPWGVSDARIGDSDVLVYARGDLRVPVYELAGGDASALWAAFEDLGAVPCGFQAVETVRLESGTARFGVDVGHDRIAMEGRLEWAIHFAKGCYVGQEVIERAVSRGRLNRVLCLLQLEGDAEVGTPIAGAGTNDVVTSLAKSPEYGNIALAYVDRDHAAAGVCLSVGGVSARVLEWPRREILAGR